MFFIFCFVFLFCVFFLMRGVALGFLFLLSVLLNYLSCRPACQAGLPGWPACPPAHCLPACLPLNGFKTRIQHAQRIQDGVLCVSKRAYWAHEVLRIWIKQTLAYWAVMFLLCLQGAPG